MTSLAPPHDAAGAKALAEAKAAVDEFDAALAAVERSLRDPARQWEGGWSEARAAAAEARDLLSGKLRWELSTGCRAPWLAMMAGGTNVGKSEIFNALAWSESAFPDARSAQTRHPLAYVHRDDVDALRASLAEGWEMLPYAGPEALNQPAPTVGGRPIAYCLEHSDDRFAGLCLFDAPDVDSDLKENREAALRLMRSVDAVIYVTLTEKYNDRLCVDFLRACAREGRTLHVAFNFAGPNNQEARDHLRREVLPKAFEGSSAPVPAVVEVPYLKEGRHDKLCDLVAGTRDELLREAAGRLERKRALARKLGKIAADKAAAVETFRCSLAAWGDTLRDGVDRKREEAKSRFVELYDELPFYELDEIFRAAYDRLEIPYLDRALGAISDVAVRAAQAVAGGGNQAPKKSALKRQREDTEDALGADILSEVEALVDAAVEADSKHPMARLAKSRRNDEALLPATTSLTPRDPAATAREKAALDEIKAELIDKIDGNPALRKAMRAARFAMMVGGGAIAFVTAGASLAFLPLALGGGMAAGVRNVMEKVGRAWVGRSRDRVYALKVERSMARFDELRDALFARLAPPLAEEDADALARSAKRFAALVEEQTKEAGA